MNVDHYPRGTVGFPDFFCMSTLGPRVHTPGDIYPIKTTGQTMSSLRFLGPSH